MPIKKSEIYSDLWKGCDELRGGMDASQYKDYILSILFVKYISDKYAGKKDSQVTIPNGASFQDMVALKGKSNIGEKLNEILKKIAELCKKVKHESTDTDYPETIDSKTKRTLYDNLDNNENLALAVDDAILTSKPDGWKDNPIKKRTVFLAIKKVLKKFKIDDDKQAKAILEIAIKQNDY